MRQIKTILIFIALQAVLAVLQWWIASSSIPLALVCLAVSAIVLPLIYGWRLGRLRTPVLLASASGALLTLAWIATGYIVQSITGEPDAGTWRRVVTIALGLLLVFQVAFAYVGGNRGLRKDKNAA